MKRYTLHLWLALAFTLALSACYPGEPDAIAQTDAVVTLHDAAYPFSKNRTWAMVDTVWPILYTRLDPITHDYDAMILLEIENAMATFGYERVDTASSTLPDVVITVADMSTSVGNWGTEPTYEDYCSWWAWCDDCCARGWNPVYPQGYPSGVFAVGTLFIEMIDPSTIDDATGEIPVVWCAIAHGVTEFDPFASRQNTRSAVRRAFVQSPYLDVSGAGAN